MPVATAEFKGTLTLAGSGIASIRHITLETLSYIERADKIFYVVTDPATEAFVQDKSKGDCSDLSIYYDKDKIRYETYVQMCEVMLKAVRAGHNVLGLFYGHPGVFVSPSHRAIAIARAEGYRAKMLPGVSAEDCLFSDLDFDPAIPGCMTQEATAIIIYNKRLDPSVHNIIWQVGAVGINNMELDNRRFHFLVDRLEEDFGLDHKVIHYIGAVLPQSPTIKDELTIADLRKEDVVDRITALSTFYLPPRTLSPASKEILNKLGLSDAPLTIMERLSAKLAGTGTKSAYGPSERAALEVLEKHVPPSDHKMLEASTAIRQFMTDLALQPDLLDRYMTDPGAVVDTIPGLSPTEKFALRLNEPGPVQAVMRTTAGRERLTIEEIAAYKEPAHRAGAILLDT